MIQSQEILYDSRYGNLTPEVAEKIRKSREEVKKLKGRALKCPVCGFRIEEIYGITMGIVQVKCRKCKLEEPLNLAYFRRIYRNQEQRVAMHQPPGLRKEILYRIHHSGRASPPKSHRKSIEPI